ncbi:MAG: UV-endonuclease UvdE [Barrevirus sp.]|uniref:UV-endonuclease UvdE n=1 Tax=Barrevirus sp. TaxID=2487763 RepID=A0A3G4ZQU8_9VIRU|nr:MAG: UV-endonuclease UvdE [Barrevirus sp.]
MKNYDYAYPKIRLGLCCGNITLKYKNDVYSSRKKTLGLILKNGLEDSKKLAKTNVIDLVKMLLWAKHHGISVMRISSDLVPHGSNNKLVESFGKRSSLLGKEAEDYISLKFIEPYLQIVGQVAKLENMRLTFHPGQFVQLASPSSSAFDNSIRELLMHATFLDMMGLNKDAVIVIHIGGTYNDKEETIKRFIKNFGKLDNKIKNRLVLENDEKCYNADDVLSICQKVGRPMVFDYHHYVCYELYHPENKQSPIDKIMPKILETWQTLGIRPKFHLSEQAPGKPIGSHSLFIDRIPDEFLSIPDKYNVDIDIMIEAKGKEIAISKLYQKYPDLRPKCSEDLPKGLPKDALKDLDIPEEIKESVSCSCDESACYIDEYHKYKSKYLELKYPE